MTSPWWLLKLLTGFALVAHALLQALGQGLDLPGTRLPLALGQTLVFLGAGMHLGHYALLRRGTETLDPPSRLVTTGGLFPYLRHPMYLGDILIYTGLAALAADAGALGLLLVGLLAIERQARREDASLAARFGAAYEAWAASTGLLLPRPVRAAA